MLTVTLLFPKKCVQNNKIFIQIKTGIKFNSQNFVTHFLIWGWDRRKSIASLMSFPLADIARYPSSFENPKSRSGSILNVRREDYPHKRLLKKLIVLVHYCLSRGN